MMRYVAVIGWLLSAGVAWAQPSLQPVNAGETRRFMSLADARAGLPGGNRLRPAAAVSPSILPTERRLMPLDRKFLVPVNARRAPSAVGALNRPVQPMPKTLPAQAFAAPLPASGSPTALDLFGAGRAAAEKTNFYQTLRGQ